MAFNDDIFFPTKIAYGSTRLVGGRSTRVVHTASGKRYTQSRKAYSINRYNVLYGIKSYEDLEDVTRIYETVGHQLEGFLFKDHLDYHSGVYRLDTPTYTDQLIGTGDASETVFQLIKTYDTASKTYVRKILKPKTGTVTISFDDVEQVSGWSVDVTNGLVTFVSPPGSSVAIKAGYEYYVPVAFANPDLDLNMDHFLHGQLGDIMLEELLNP